MTFRLLAASLGIVAVLSLAGVASSQEKNGPDQAQPKTDPAQAQPKPEQPEAKAEGTPETTKPAASKDTKPKFEKATFGGGCFWCVETVFERIPGVKNVVSGYAGGTVAFPTYQQVCTGLTGHAEVIQITFDPAIVSYEKLLQTFWKAHDPTTLNSQGDDFGTQYRSIILYHSNAQKQAALKSYKDLTARRVFPDPIVTQLVPMGTFYPAEAYHQDYYRNHPDSFYTQFYIELKLIKMQPHKTKKKTVARPK